LNESDLQLYPFVEDTKKPVVIPFKDDLLFHFFNKDTQISDNYIFDPVSGLKLYPTQSNCIKPTALSTGFPIPNSEIDLIEEIESFFHHKLSELENFGYLFEAENTGSTAITGMYLTSGKTGYNLYWKGSASSGCIILTSALEDDNWYISNCYIGSTLSHKMRKVTLVDNELIIGLDINSTTTAKGTASLTSDLGVLCGRNSAGSQFYSSKHKFGYIKIYGAGRTLMHHFVFSEGAETQVFDIVTGNAYTVNNATLPNLWTNNKQDFYHHNFKYGFTLYQKSGSPDLRIPNKLDGTEIVPAAIPSGYTRIANYKECKKSFNQCENLFKLDDVSVSDGGLTLTGWGDSVLNGAYHIVDTYEGKPRYIDNTLLDYTHFIVWQSGQWKIGVSGGIVKWTSSEDVATPDLVTTWTVFGTGTAPAGTIEAAESSPLYSADYDHYLFTENTGVAKEIDLKLLNMASISDRGYLYYNETLRQSFMLYATDKTLINDIKIIKYIGMSSRISYDESGDINYDENNHCELTEV
jgi:hypothetical protein